MPPAAKLEPPAPVDVSLARTPVLVASWILSASSWGDRTALLALNKHWWESVFGDDASWKLMCRFLHRDNYIYSAPVCISTSWRTLFAELWPLRSRWFKSEGPLNKVVYSAAEMMRRERAGETDLILEPMWKKPVDTYSFDISVVVRLRPKHKDGDAGCAEDATTVVLPLHQRIALIRQHKGCSKDEAFDELFRAPNGHCLDGATLTESECIVDHEAGAAEPVAEPTEPTELSEDTVAKANTVAGVVSVSPKEVVICAPSIGLRPFTCFDSVLCDTASQAAVYETVARRQVADFVNGLNCTIFCYGQTGSGKTHTLFGKDADTATSLVSVSPEAGLVPRACAEISAAVVQRKAIMDCKLQLSYVEVYGEEVSDLLKGDHKSVGTWKGTAVRAVLDGCMSVTVDSMEHMQSLLQQGEVAKRRAETAMNSRSSRAHALLILTLTQKAGSVEAVSNLCLADLGGSEQLSKSGATGLRMQEAIGINKGLLALKQCIRALNKKSHHVPYHDSKLTELLSSALGGNSKTTVVVTASPEPRHASESLQALRFGEACAVVTNVANVQQSSVAHLIAELDAKIRSTEAMIKKNERWERFEEEMPIDEFGDGGGIRTRMKLVGAEKERELLEYYLKSRRALLGEPDPDEKEMAKTKTTTVETNAVDQPNVERPGGKDVANWGQSVSVSADKTARDSRNCNACDSIPAHSSAAAHESKEETPMETKALRMKTILENKQKGMAERMQQKQDRRAETCAKATEREVRAAKRKEELLAAKQEKARQQRERVARKQEQLRRFRDESSSDLEATLLSVEAELAESIRDSGMESEHSIALSAKAADFRQHINDFKSRSVTGEDKTGLASQELAVFSRRSLLLADDGQAQATDGWQADLVVAAGAAPALSCEEKDLIAEHRRGQALVSVSSD